MKNVTITLDEQVAASTRVEAAKQGKSMSRYISDILTERHGRQSSQRETLERFLAGPDLPLSENGRLPTKEELYAERLFRRHEHLDLRTRPDRAGKTGPSE